MVVEEEVVVLWLVLVVLVVGVDEEAVEVEVVVLGAQGFGRGSLFSRPACAASTEQLIRINIIPESQIIKGFIYIIFKHFSSHALTRIISSSIAA